MEQASAQARETISAFRAGVVGVVVGVVGVGMTTLLGLSVRLLLPVRPA
jgi:hypothetical protein